MPPIAAATPGHGRTSSVGRRASIRGIEAAGSFYQAAVIVRRAKAIVALSIHNRIGGKAFRVPASAPIIQAQFHRKAKVVGGRKVAATTLK